VIRSSGYGPLADRFDVIATVYIGLGDREATFGWLEEAYPGTLHRAVVPRLWTRFEPVRDDQRYGQPLRRIDLSADVSASPVKG
jgi:hypothetical protein